MTPADETGFEQRIIDNVASSGCHINLVFDPDSEEPDFAYSIGFPETVGQPEVIVFGLDRDVMHFMINETLRQCRDGLQLVDWQQIEGLLEGHRCIARVVLPEFVEDEYFNSARWYRQHTTGDAAIDAVQICWPGAADGLFVWDEGGDARLSDWQPPLYEGAIH